MRLFGSKLQRLVIFDESGRVNYAQREYRSSRRESGVWKSLVQKRELIVELLRRGRAKSADPKSVVFQARIRNARSGFTRNSTRDGKLK